MFKVQVSNKDAEERLSNGEFYKRKRNKGKEFKHNSDEDVRQLKTK